MNDPRGSVLQLVRSSDNAPIAINEDGTYKGNVVADMQIMVAKAIQENILENTPQLQTFVNSINTTIIEWASSGTATFEPRYRCNGDSMHHVNKGMTMIRVEDAMGFDIRRNIISHVSNLSPPAFKDCFDYHGAGDESGPQQGANIRGISVSAVTSYKKRLSSVVGNRIKNFKSEEANIIVGIDVQGKSDSISIMRNGIELAKPKKKQIANKDKYIALRMYQESEDVIIMNNHLAEKIVLSRGEISNTSRGCPMKKRIEWHNGELPGVSVCPFANKP